MKTKIGIIGGGNMGSAIIGGIHRCYDVSVCEQDQKRRDWLKRTYRGTSGDLASVVKKSQIIILAVKPQSFDDVLKQIRPFLTKNKLVVSIAAGITCRYIEKRLGTKIRVVRTMPNLPAQVKQGVTGICAGKAATRQDVTLVRKLFDCVGTTVVVKEKYMDAVTAASGSGPAYVFLFIESLVKAVRSLGFSEKIAKELVLKTVTGSLDLLGRQREDAAVLRQRVTSKGGTTQAAMDVFKSKDFDGIFKAALHAARKRAKELSR
jgi:pyrroline-5-carboxylate reductase